MLTPMYFWKAVWQLAHTMLAEGHLGQDKIIAKTVQWFFQPGLHEAVMHRGTCAKCQRVNKIRPPWASLQGMPIIETSFDRIPMDIVGPLLCKSSTGCQFILVIVDNPT